MKERNGVVDNSHLSARASGVSLTGDPIEPAWRTIKGEEREALQKADPKLQGRGEMGCLTTLDEPAFAIPGLDPDAVAPEGVDAGLDEGGCESGACKL
ncbi:hypothetical protein PHOBOS_116 [Erwinia phage vB_EamM_Phobos]|uniref:hypothetical protein n=1 Tax=Erwinia phage vB_EamM_Phobos TaxID=1883377 RepID=UPI00081D2493|nr:hypothetical protein BIZ79_gp116 [Erwinia phage vB_EamM_Phobos]ANZ50306.1 hypothetical protein PHOBOS_116 [Erwinia phage vB_EamM_Phobos]